MNNDEEEIKITGKKIKGNARIRKKLFIYIASILVFLVIYSIVVDIYIRPTDPTREINLWKINGGSDNESPQKPVSVQNYGSPESQFKEFQKDRMGPNYDILNVIMNLHKVDGNRMVYKGFYTYQISGTTHKDKVFFFANFENGRFTGWLPDR